MSERSSMAYKDVVVNGEIFRCGVDWTVEQAEARIRVKFGLQHGCIEEDGGGLLGSVVIGSLAGSLAFVGGQAIQQPAVSFADFDFSELAKEVHGIALVTHAIKETIPTVVVGINITPSEASGKKSAEFKKLLDCLNIDPPVPTTEVFTDISMFSTATYEDEDEGTTTTLRPFSWHWNQRLEEASYEPFCTYLNCIKRNGVKEFYCYIVEKGQRLDDALLFDHDVITLRSLDSQGNRVKLLYRGHVRGRTDLVVMHYAPLGNISRHMVRFAVEVKTAEEMRKKFTSCIREAATQVVGLCVDNSNNSPCVILTDFSVSFYVLHLRISDRSSPALLKYDIVIQTCDGILSALNKACEVSAFCISHDFCRPTTPEEYTA